MTVTALVLADRELPVAVVLRVLRENLVHEKSFSGVEGKGTPNDESLGLRGSECQRAQARTNQRRHDQRRSHHVLDGCRSIALRMRARDRQPRQQKGVRNSEHARRNRGRRARISRKRIIGTPSAPLRTPNLGGGAAAGTQLLPVTAAAVTAAR